MRELNLSSQSDDVLGQSVTFFLCPEASARHLGAKSAANRVAKIKSAWHFENTLVTYNISRRYTQTSSDSMTPEAGNA